MTLTELRAYTGNATRVQVSYNGTVGVFELDPPTQLARITPGLLFWTARLRQPGDGNGSLKTGVPGMVRDGRRMDDTTAIQIRCELQGKMCSIELHTY